MMAQAGDLDDQARLTAAAFDTSGKSAAELRRNLFRRTPEQMLAFEAEQERYLQARLNVYDNSPKIDLSSGFKSQQPNIPSISIDDFVQLLSASSSEPLTESAVQSKLEKGARHTLSPLPTGQQQKN